MESYIYEDLRPGEHIRLLDISPGLKGEPIICKIHLASLAQPPAYTTLSYFWGEPLFDHSVQCDGKEIKITKNLYLALQRLRHLQGSRLVWADAICINQADIGERSYQVGLMRAIYSRAVETIVYIGEGSFPASLLQSFSSTLLKTADLLSPKQYIIDADSDLAEFDLPPLKSVEWQSLREFFAAAWFRRIWVLQEYVLSPKVLIIYGDWKISSDFLQKMFYSFMDHSFFGLIFPFREGGSQDMIEVHDWEINVDITRTLWLLVTTRQYRNSNDDNLASLLRREFNQQASDPRDYVYGLLGLASDGWQARIQPDYSLSVSQVYIKTCQYFIQSSGKAKFLSEVGPPYSITSLPSWVPDWSTNRLFNIIDFDEVYDAGYGLEQKWRFEDDQSVLSGRGAIVDTVAFTTANPMPSRDNPVAYADKAGQYFHETMDVIRSSAATFEKTSMATLHFDLLTMENPRNGGVTIEVEHYEAWKAILQHRSADWLGSQSELIKKATDFVILVEDRAATRKACLTASHAVGQVPGCTQVGDSICIFADTRTPYVLRPHSKRENCYTLIGECYVRGVMRRGFQTSDLIKDIRLV